MPGNGGEGHKWVIDIRIGEQAAGRRNQLHSSSRMQGKMPHASLTGMSDFMTLWWLMLKYRSGVKQVNNQLVANSIEKKLLRVRSTHNLHDMGCR